MLRNGEDVGIIAVGPMVGLAMDSAEQLNELRLQAAVVNLRFIKPLDEEMILDLARRCKRIVTVEEGALMGGMGSAVLELLADRGLTDVRVTRLGLPDHYIEHGAPQIQREECGLTPGDFTQAARDLLEATGGEVISLAEDGKKPAA